MQFISSRLKPMNNRNCGGQSEQLKASVYISGLRDWKGGTTFELLSGDFIEGVCGRWLKREPF